MAPVHSQKQLYSPRGAPRHACEDGCEVTRWLLNYPCAQPLLPVVRRKDLMASITCPTPLFAKL